MSGPYAPPSYWDFLEPRLPARVRSRCLPTMKVRYLPNTGSEIGLSMALQGELEADGWLVDAEVQTGGGRHVDIVAWMGPVMLVIEVKDINAGPAAIEQLVRYLGDIGNPRAVGILAAPSLTATVSFLPDNIRFLPLVRA